MSSARTTMIEQSSVTTLATCPFCQFRDVSTNEERLRLRLLDHLMMAHDSDSQPQRDSLKRWLARKGVAA